MKIDHIRSSVLDKLYDKDSLILQASQSRALVDSYGTLRVAEFICPTTIDNVIIEKKLTTSDDVKSSWSGSTKAVSVDLIEKNKANKFCEQYINCEISFIT